MKKRYRVEEGCKRKWKEGQERVWALERRGEEFEELSPPESAEIDPADAAYHRGGIIIEQSRFGFQKTTWSFGSFGSGFPPGLEAFFEFEKIRWNRRILDMTLYVYNDRQSKRIWLTINAAKLPFNIQLNTGSRAINQFSLQAGCPRGSWHIRCNR